MLIYIYTHLSICLSIYLSIYLFAWIICLFKSPLLGTIFAYAFCPLFVPGDLRSPWMTGSNGTRRMSSKYPCAMLSTAPQPARRGWAHGSDGGPCLPKRDQGTHMEPIWMMGSLWKIPMEYFPWPIEDSNGFRVAIGSICLDLQTDWTFVDSNVRLCVLWRSFGLGL